jgi:hypothetical protein
MNSDITKRWIEAGKLIATDSCAKVPCPACQAAALQIEDVRSEINPSLLERHMLCPQCGAYNSLRLTRPQPEPTPILSVFVNGMEVASITESELPCEKKPTLQLERNSIIEFVDSKGSHIVHSLGASEGWFHFSIRLQKSLACQADCAITKGEIYDPAAFSKGEVTGIRFQPFFLPGAGTSNDIFAGRGLFKRGLHYSGSVTNGAIRISCLCDHCKKSFLIRSYHTGFSEAGYFYSDSGAFTLTVSSYIPGAPAALSVPDPVQLAELEMKLPKAPDGTSFRFANPFRCPHCHEPYIDFQRFPEERKVEYYGNYFVDDRLLKYEPAAVA